MQKNSLCKNEKQNDKYASYKDCPINSSEFLIELRKLMNKSINELIYDMGWPNEKYYSKIVNGYYDKNNSKKYCSPTVNYLFGGIKYALSHNEKYIEKQDEIIKLIHKYFISIN